MTGKTAKKVVLAKRVPIVYNDSHIRRCVGIGRRGGLKIYNAVPCRCAGKPCVTRTFDNLICIWFLMSLHDVPPLSRTGHREQDVENKNAGVLELVDEVDSKSIASDGVRVRVPPPAPPPRGPKVLDLQALSGFPYCPAWTSQFGGTWYFFSMSLHFSGVFGGTFYFFPAGYTPMIAFAEATFELKSRCV